LLGSPRVPADAELGRHARDVLRDFNLALNKGFKRVAVLTESGVAQGGEKAEPEVLETEERLLSNIDLAGGDRMVCGNLGHTLVIEVTRGRVDPVNLVLQPFEEERVAGGPIPAPRRHAVRNLASRYIERHDPRKVSLPVLKGARQLVKERVLVA
jgi:hypothetical protein